MRWTTPLSLFLCLPLAAPALAVAGVVQATGDAALFAVQEPGAVRLGGDGPAIDLPAQATLSHIEPLSGGWVASATTPTASGRDIVIVLADGGRTLVVPPPPAEALFRGNPVPLVDGGALAGLAWIEGNDSQAIAVRAAAWDGASWGPAETVSPASTSQLALAGDVLADGGWLLVWSRVEGGDAEIAWSRRSPAGAWSPTRRMHEDNAVPDVTPAIAAAQRGAIAAWSWFDGRDYRIRTARLDGARWLEGAVLPGRGTTVPTLHRRGTVIDLLTDCVVPAGWWIFELDAAGAAARGGLVAGGPSERPALRGEGEALTLWWPATAERPPLELRPVWETP